MYIMNYAVLARKDDTMELLAFGSMDSVCSFIKFVVTYQRESGAGNGYGAYWIFDDKVVQVDPADDRLVRSLERDRIISMAYDIAYARSGGSGIVTVPAITYGTKDDGIIFQVWGFDQGSTPNPGDMCRVIKPELLPTDKLRSRDGRVTDIFVDQARVLDCADEGSEGPKNKAEPYLIPLEALMKIPDWLESGRLKP